MKTFGTIKVLLVTLAFDDRVLPLLPLLDILKLDKLCADDIPTLTMSYCAQLWCKNLRHSPCLVGESWSNVFFSKIANGSFCISCVDSDDRCIIKIHNDFLPFQRGKAQANCANMRGRMVPRLLKIPGCKYL